MLTFFRTGMFAGVAAAMITSCIYFVFLKYGSAIYLSLLEKSTLSELLFNHETSTFLVSLFQRYLKLIFDIAVAAAVLKLNAICMGKFVYFMDASNASRTIKSTTTSDSAITQAVCDIFGQTWFEHPIICDDDFTAPPVNLLRTYGHNF
ncbi:uncharacterized protein LOC129581146 [Paramacrobiotus metropolitanus]|uniref:uncharacterized protein LOC129581146 n=1 Tax=Paramacrobiotus metropolitanus TaxID=2943436 RepID=UPI0024456F71|nr:uncharacterized protein LOC129581146 [Paramacrobiotus metropolitanus]